jgi:hypothetical protein
LAELLKKIFSSDRSNVKLFETGENIKKSSPPKDQMLKCLKLEKTLKNLLL